MSVFREKINNLARGENKKPHKYIALLTIIIILNKQKFKQNKIIFDTLFKEIFSSIFCKVARNKDSNRPWTPFFHLRSSGLVSLVPKEGINLSEISTVGSEKDLRTYVSYATLLPDFFESLKDEQIQRDIVREIHSNLRNIHQNQLLDLVDTACCVSHEDPSISSQVKQMHFLNYLSTLQRIHGGNENALAEFQAQNPVFACIAAPHPLEEKLVDDLREGSYAIILTGHAGDGKTTLAYAVYRKLLGISPKEQRPELAESIVPFFIEGNKALLIKDLSEQEKARHGDLMAALLDTGTRSLLVSNTGALREFFLSQEPDSSKHVELETKLLASLSKEQDDSFSFQNRKFKIYNLALRDNLPLAEEVLTKMLAPELWQSCTNCQKKNLCPVFFNCSILADKDNSARDRLFLAYRRLQAYGVRLTMRQLSEHLAYCLSGGLDEQHLCQRESLPRKIGSKQHLYNLFFGGPHAKPDTYVADMAAIRAIHDQKIGSYPLSCVDKKLWHILSPDIKDLGIPKNVAPFFQELARIGSQHGNPEAGAEARLQARRLLYFCSKPEDGKLKERLQQEFLDSPGVLLYAGLGQNSQLEQSTKRLLMVCLYHVLQEHFTGIHLPTSNRMSSRATLYITLNRPTPLLRQSVQAVLCTVSWQENFDLRIHERASLGKYLVLEGRRNLKDITPLELTVPFLDYVLRRFDGEVSDLPRATFGQQLDTLKAQIICCMREEEDPNTMRLLRYCSDYNLVLDEYILNDAMLEVIRGTY